MKLTKSRQGFTLVEIMIVVGIIGLLAAIAIPNFIRYRAASRRGVCIANLRQLQNAKTTWAMERAKKGTDTPVETDLIGTLSYLRDKPVCPSGGADYFTTINDADHRAGCTIAVLEGHTL